MKASTDSVRKAGEQQQQKTLRVTDWFTEPQCENVVRRREVWGLLGWYHENIVRPQLGLRGFFRRLWWRLSGQRRRLLSPWQEIAFVNEERARMQRLMAENGDLQAKPSVIQKP